MQIVSTTDHPLARHHLGSVIWVRAGPLHVPIAVNGHWTPRLDQDTQNGPAVSASAAGSRLVGERLGGGQCHADAVRIVRRQTAAAVPGHDILSVPEGSGATVSASVN